MGDYAMIDQIIPYAMLVVSIAIMWYFYKNYDIDKASTYVEDEQGWWFD